MNANIGKLLNVHKLRSKVDIDWFNLIYTIQDSQ